ncbi:MAG: MerR family transcriptional regulator [Bacteriovoracaceae bacterium]|nr:MerR family transcriptional regulator [Bacteriovoracaceae bacterium]
MILIKDFSKQTDISIRMLRYLEEIGLLVPSRAENNYRYYSEEQIGVAKRVKELQELGFQLKEIKEVSEGDLVLQKEVLAGVLHREKEVAEIKSETIPKLKHYLDQLNKNQHSFFELLQMEACIDKKLKTLGGEPKFHRTAYNIPILKTIYEDHIAISADIDLIRTDLMKFSEFLEQADHQLDVYSILNESCFAFGYNLNESFIESYKESWKKFLPDICFLPLQDFTKDELKELMGQHDVIIRSHFKYQNGEVGEVTIPYAPIYTMSKLK